MPCLCNKFAVVLWGYIAISYMNFHQPFKAVKLLNNLSFRGKELKGKKTFKMNGGGGGDWEESVAQQLERDARVRQVAPVNGEVGLLVELFLW